jgi:hypothetical protein
MRCEKSQGIWYGKVWHSCVLTRSMVHFGESGLYPAFQKGEAALCNCTSYEGAPCQGNSHYTFKRFDAVDALCLPLGKTQVTFGKYNFREVCHGIMCSMDTEPC